MWRTLLSSGLQFMILFVRKIQQLWFIDEEDTFLWEVYFLFLILLWENIIDYANWVNILHFPSFWLLINSNFSQIIKQRSSLVCLKFQTALLFEIKFVLSR